MLTRKLQPYMLDKTLDTNPKAQNIFKPKKHRHETQHNTGNNNIDGYCN